MISKKEFWIAVSNQFAQRYKTSPAVIRYIRSYGIAGYDLEKIKTHTKEKREKLEKVIDMNRTAILKRETPDPKYDIPKEVVQKRLENIKLNNDWCYKKKAFLLEVAMFLQAIPDKTFADITSKIQYKE